MMSLEKKYEVNSTPIDVWKVSSKSTYKDIKIYKHVNYCTTSFQENRLRYFLPEQKPRTAYFNVWETH